MTVARSTEIIIQCVDVQCNNTYSEHLTYQSLACFPIHVGVHRYSTITILVLNIQYPPTNVQQLILPLLHTSIYCYISTCYVDVGAHSTSCHMLNQ